MSQPIFFAHANGFPSACYGKLFAALSPEFEVAHLVQHGHDPRFPVDDNWGNLVAELIHHVQQQRTPVWGVGHSLGGVLHYQAALQRPELYRGVVMLDSPILGVTDRLLIRAAKRFGFIDRITPAGRTLGRRETFSDQAEAREYFAGKTLFRGFDPDCLDAYVQHALEPNEASLRLRFNAQTEVSIYRSVPHRKTAHAPLQVPLALVRGAQSKVVLRHHAYLFQRAKRGQFYRVEGGHMFPLERPLNTAQLLKQVLSTWADAAKTGAGQ
ncbi:alpha/beta fold hydrolase [Pseudomonas sp. 5P_3.1_Bac2]|uniref:alpha/beta fold hydrolase n=1 Tax=Pseudomonas sp. 5P_3.1_Bac2 TaxID=2971617 RepID=UPI0021C96D23|nr:alpha/beta hydrolase [Pseudomonas sp. 5P_3.1_Bac2]MCU1716947.1 alpha/beta hydrolase [Pseudomonas sp. 5P_3.1_Bac2]